MAFATESVTLAGSGLVFINSYDASVSAAYRSAIISAEHELQSHFTSPVTISVDFTLAPLGPGAAASNQFGTVAVSYADFAAALRAHATSADDHTAVNGLPAADPSHGVGFEIPVSQAVALGLFPQTNLADVSVTLNSNLAWTFGQDAIGAIEHELTEGGFGRIGSLGLADTLWAPLDLFRFTAAGERDFTGGSDGKATFFGLDGAHLSALQYHSAISASGAFDGQDLGDWSGTRGDAFGPGGPNSPGAMSATDIQVVDILGWNTATFTPAADDFANSRTDASHAIGQLAIGGAIAGTLQQAGDRDWFAVTLQAGHTYVFEETGWKTGDGTLGDPYLRLHDATGAEIASNDDIVNGDMPDSSITFTAQASGTFYLEAGAYVDGYAGSYKVSAFASGSATAGGDTLKAGAGLTSIDGGAGNDTIEGWAGGDRLRGGDGNDSIAGGLGFDDINGNKGDDTIDGGAGGDDWLVGGQGNDLITAHDTGNVLLGNLGSDTLQGGAGDEILRGGQADDVLSGGDGNDWLSGDRGTDTISGGAGADTFHSFSGAGFDQVNDFNYAEGDRVQLDPGTTYHLIQAGADLVVDMGNGDEMVLKNVTLASLPSDWIFER